ncbi:hypothetical protein D3C77_422510 [compost metagenome]
MLLCCFGASAVGAPHISELFLERRLQSIQLAQLLVQGVNLAGKLAFLLFEALDPFVVGLLELVELTAQGFGDVIDVFLFNSHERLLTFCPKGISVIEVRRRHPPLAVKLRRSPWP